VSNYIYRELQLDDTKLDTPCEFVRSVAIAEGVQVKKKTKKGLR